MGVPQVIHIRRCCQDERAAHPYLRHDIVKVKRSLMYFKLHCYPESTFELSTDMLDWLLRVLARVTSITSTGADEGDAAATYLDSVSSGTGPGGSASFREFCSCSIGATP